MPEDKKIMLSTDELIREIISCDSFLKSDELFKKTFSLSTPHSRAKTLECILSPEFYSENSDLFEEPKIEGRILTDLLQAKRGKNAVIGLRYTLAERIADHFSLQKNALSFFSMIFDKDALNPGFALRGLVRIEKILRSEPENLIDRIRPNSKQSVIDDLYEKDVKLDVMRKAFLYLFHKERYAEFFWWLFIFSVLQEDILLLYDNLPVTQYAQMMSYFATVDKDLELLRRKPLVNVRFDDFWNIRRKLVETAHGEIIITGSCIKEAFDRSHERSISECLKKSIEAGNLTKISVLLTDPIIFDDDGKCGDPISDIQSTINSLENGFYSLCEEKGVELYVYFLPLLQVDHSVITDEFMLFRSNKLWNYTRKFKGSYTCHVADYYTCEDSEYLAHLEYLEAIMENSTIIYPDMDINDNEDELFKARNLHMEWRKHLRAKGYTHIRFYKLYEKQIQSYVKSTWYASEERNIQLIPFGKIQTYDDFYNPGNLLDDDSQNVLLPYIRETERLFTEAIKKHDRSERSYCHIYPSLDLGFPNNVRRLAGGFATGMLVTWQCGIDIVPVDATVNVCTSSVFKLDRFDETYLNDNDAFYRKIDDYARTAGAWLGYSFSFTSGNHFLLIAKDESDGSYYLVLHSSANELKHSYMGLYPVEGNWYSNKIKNIKSENSNRYFRYLKDEDARYFIQMTKNFQTYNEQNLSLSQSEHLLSRLALRFPSFPLMASRFIFLKSEKIISRLIWEEAKERFA